jgi:hypothetical protein
MKTAMQELLSEMSNPNWNRLSFDARYKMFDKLLDLEKEQIIQARIDGDENYSLVGGKRYEYAEQYYNEKYNQKKS